MLYQLFGEFYNDLNLPLNFISVQFNIFIGENKYIFLKLTYKYKVIIFARSIFNRQKFDHNMSPAFIDKLF